MQTPNLPAIRALRPAWNKGRIVGQKLPLKPKHVWAIRVRLELAENHRDLALFNMAIDSKLRGCDLVRMKVVDVMASGQIKARASVLQSKTQKPVRFEISEGTRASVAKWMEDPLMVGSEYLWPGRFHERLNISTRQYARIVRDWVASIGLEVTAYGTHSMRRTKVTQIYKKTVGSLRIRTSGSASSALATACVASRPHDPRDGDRCRKRRPCIADRRDDGNGIESRTLCSCPRRNCKSSG
jgi:hypothetical protein